MKDYKLIIPGNRVEYACGKNRDEAINKICKYYSMPRTAVKSCKEIQIK